MQLQVACLLAVAISLIQSSLAFKAEDFKNCQDASFCARMRGATSTAFQVDSSTLAIKGPSVTARIINKDDSNGTFALTLTAYNDIVRLHITEPSANPPRYEVPDVLLTAASDMQRPWEVVKKTATKIKLKNGNADVDLQYAPVALALFVKGRPVLTWNAGGNFLIEHRRQKKDDDPEGWWSESFKTHHDSKPRGPEALSFDVKLHGFDHVFGLPERATSHSLSPTLATNGSVVSEPYRLYNLDVFEYLAESPFGLYGSIPLLLSHRSGQSVGVFWLNAAEMYVDVAKPSNGVSTQWMAESGVVDVFFLLGPTPQAISTQFASLTGGTALPQMFALGYHQCRWNYNDQDDVAAVDGGFDAHDIPYDVLWLDIEHTNGKRYFSWDSNHFPTPTEMQDDVASRGRKMVTIVDPHIKRDPDWRVFSEARDKGLFVKDREGKDYDGWCWPGASSYLDYSSSDVRNWWADQFSLAAYQGSTPNLYIWNDMNEPSVFNGPEISMHKDAKHASGAEHRDVHNAYGFFYHMATADGLRRRGMTEHAPDGDRPFVLSRAFFAGTQRIGAIWTGDNSADWEHLEVSVPMLLTIGVTGLPFSGADVGGFFGNPDAELMMRWYQVGAYYPFFRGHAHLESKRREPWLFGEEATSVIREAIRQRYRLMPHLYTLFFHANVTGAPVMRPLWYEFPLDKSVMGEDKIFLLGSSILVAPVLTQGAESVRVVLPGRDMWYDGDDGIVIDSAQGPNREFQVPAAIDRIRTFYRGGTMVALKERARRSTVAMSNDPVTLIIALDRLGKAHGDLYLDDGRSYAFQRGQYIHMSYTFAADGTLTSTAAVLPAGAPFPAADSTYKDSTVIDRVVVLGLPNGPQGWTASIVSRGVTGKSQDEQRLDAQPGPLFLKPGMPATALVIRKAQLPAGKDWVVKFARGVGSGGATSR